MLAQKFGGVLHGACNRRVAGIKDPQSIRAWHEDRTGIVPANQLDLIYLNGSSSHRLTL
jgi:hypothetical protein